ncbi:MAG: N-acetyltransferase family protein [Acidimicrobiia bacterium]
MIRPARPPDLDTIAALIRELAAYEELDHEVVLDEGELHAHLFGPRPYAEVLIAEDDRGEPVGFALYFHNFSTFLGRPGIHLEDLFVRPEHRGAGHGLALLGAVGAIARARGCGRIEWNVLDWNEASIAFYESLGARPMSEWLLYRLTGDAMDALADA